MKLPGYNQRVSCVEHDIQGHVDYRTSRYVYENVSKSEFCEVNHSKSTSRGLRDCLECLNGPKNELKEIGGK